MHLCIAETFAAIRFWARKRALEAQCLIRKLGGAPSRLRWLPLSVAQTGDSRGASRRGRDSTQGMSSAQTDDGERVLGTEASAISR